MRVVKLLMILILFLFILVSGCENKNQLLPTNNRGGYFFEFLNSQEIVSDSLLVMGSLFDVETMQPLEGSYVRFHCRKTKADNYGRFSFKVSPNLDQPYFFEGGFIGYKTVTTDVIVLESGILKLNFYLALDTTPIYHCNE